jgi:tetratricopeptide (TPR) repeat protein
MITPSSIEYISQVLSEPHAITDADHESIESLVDSYPYFVPARYMQAAERHKSKPFDGFMMATMKLYDGNWLLFHEFLKKSLGDREVEVVYEAPVQETYHAEEIITATKEEVYTLEPEFDTVLEETPDPVQDDDRSKGFVFEAPAFKEEPANNNAEDETLILPVYTEDYFLHQGVQVSNDIPAEVEQHGELDHEAKSLMVVMSFTEWLNHFKIRSERAREEEEDQRALKTMWQKEKLVAALEEENEEIPEKVFQMAVNSIAKEDDLASESLAEIYVKQGKYDAAIDMYKKLSLRNPQKSSYFARRIDAVLKEKTI